MNPVSLRTNISSIESAHADLAAPAFRKTGGVPALVSYLSRWIRPLGAVKSFRQYIHYVTSFGSILEAYNGPIHGETNGPYPPGQAITSNLHVATLDKHDIYVLHSTKQLWQIKEAA